VVLLSFSPKTLRSCVRACQHAPSSECRRMSHIRGKGSPPRFFPFSLQFTHVSRSVGGRVTPSARAYLFSPLKISPETGGHRLVLSLVMVVIYVKQNIAYKSAAFDATCHFGHEVREIIPSSKMSDERFTHGNRFTDCVVTNRITLLL
jgi:hypothetical protein